VKGWETKVEWSVGNITKGEKKGDLEGARNSGLPAFLPERVSTRNQEEKTVGGIRSLGVRRFQSILNGTGWGTGKSAGTKEKRFGHGGLSGGCAVGVRVKEDGLQGIMFFRRSALEG